MQKVRLLFFNVEKIIHDFYYSEKRESLNRKITSQFFILLYQVHTKNQSAVAYS